LDRFARNDFHRQQAKSMTTRLMDFNYITYVENLQKKVEKITNYTTIIGF